MRYTYIRLDGFRRFALNEFEHFEMHIVSALQLIIGTNGSGKSSLLEQLTPLPPDPTDFSKTGGKVLRLEHNHKQYELSAVFSPKRIYSFKVDGEEKNEGGTISIQSDLVKEHFGITQEIHKLLLGREKFSSMSPARRKEWLLRLCDTNYDYAIRVYNKAKDNLRDTKGAVNLARKTLVQESEKLLGDEEMNLLKAESESLHACLNELLEYRKPVEADLDTLDIQQEQFDRQLMSLSRNLLQLQEMLKDNEYTVDEYTVFIAQAAESITATTALLEQASTEYQKNDEKIKLLQKAEAKSAEKLQQEVDELNAKVTGLLRGSLLPLGLSNAKTALMSFEGLKTHLAAIFSEIPDNGEGQFSSQNLEYARNAIQALTQQRVVQSEHLEKTRIGIRHMEAHKANPDMSCPKCSHKFSAQYDEAKHQSLQADAIQRASLIEKEIGPKIGEKEAYIARCAEYGQLYRQYVQLTSSARILQPYWALAEEANLIKAKAREGVNWLQAVHDDLQKQIAAEEAAALMSDKRELIRSLLSIGSADLKTLQERNEVLEAQLNSLTTALQKARSSKTFYEAEQGRLKQFHELRGKIRTVINHKRELNKTTLETIRRQEVNALIRALQSELAIREQRIGSASQQKSIVDNLSARIDDYAAQEAAWAILVKEMSPTEGLIAEGLLGFIKNFIDQTNSIIQSVWSYPLVIQSCEVIEGAALDLDYRFPLKVASRTEPVSDVSKGSTGMIEIVDMAFKMTAMQYLHLQDSALYLDEPGQTFDDSHRSEFAFIVKNLIEQQTFPQIFMISHYFEMYGSFGNADICALNKLNVAVPDNCNRNVVLS